MLYVATFAQLLGEVHVGAGQLAADLPHNALVPVQRSGGFE